MDIKLIGVPDYWKASSRRWKCPHCKVEGWSSDGATPIDHDKPNGKVCAKMKAKSNG